MTYADLRPGDVALPLDDTSAPWLVLSNDGGRLRYVLLNSGVVGAWHLDVSMTIPLRHIEVLVGGGS